MVTGPLMNPTSLLDASEEALGPRLGRASYLELTDVGYISGSPIVRRAMTE
jgi:hypothetical protein